MESLSDDRAAWLELQHLVDENDEASLCEFLDGLSPREILSIVSRLDEERRARLLGAVDASRAAALLDQVPDIQAAETIERLDPPVAAAILHELPDSERTDLLGDVEPEAAESIVRAMDVGDAETARLLGKYEDDIAGGLMSREYLAYPEQTSVGEVVVDLRAHAERYREFVVQYAFVVTNDGKLVGVLRFRDLLFGRQDRSIGEVMLRDPIAVRDTDELEELRAVFDRYEFYGIPVVDGERRLVGLVRRSAVIEAVADESTTVFLKTQGIVGGEELRAMPLMQRSRRRLAWLSVNILLNIVAASVIAANQETLAAVIALAVFLPIISDMSGCSGNQAVAVSLRELSLGLLRPAELRRVWLKEISVGLINGIALGALLAGVAWAWQGNAWLGLVVGVAMTANTLVAVSIGGVVPLVLRRFGMDPALASGPILTTVTDMCGFFLLLSIAGAMLPRLV